MCVGGEGGGHDNQVPSANCGHGLPNQPFLCNLHKRSPHSLNVPTPLPFLFPSPLPSLSLSLSISNPFSFSEIGESTHPHQTGMCLMTCQLIITPSLPLPHPCVPPAQAASLAVSPSLPLPHLGVPPAQAASVAVRPTPALITPTLPLPHPAVPPGRLARSETDAGAHLGRHCRRRQQHHQRCGMAVAAAAVGSGCRRRVRCTATSLCVACVVGTTTQAASICAAFNAKPATHREP